jgi:CheY-like chemotaxis protein
MLLSAYPQLPGGVVLCIDNDQNILECERAFLECFGYTVLTASSGGKGLELASIHPVDVVILDYFMLATNGQQVATELRRLSPQAPIILLTEKSGVPNRTLNLVDALVVTDRLASQLLPTIAQLRGCARIPQPCYNA